MKYKDVGEEKITITIHSSTDKYCKEIVTQTSTYYIISFA